MATNRWDDIDTLITEHKTALKAAQSHLPLKEFAETHGLMNKGDFSKFKHLLKKIGVNYDSLREKAFQQHDAERAQALDDLTDAPFVTLWAAACDDDGDGSFAIVDSDNEARWYGKLFDDDRVWKPGDLISAEQSAADKAVWIASQAFHQAGHDVGELRLITTCPHLDTTALAAQGVRLGVKVTVTVDDNDSRAVDMAEVPGYRNWKETNLAELVVKATDEA
ncbi:MAG: hypothetical protein SOW59_08515 [Corynebacterium sp.]|nr:hypothetical protein [Corynebacterium sp.]